MAGLLLISSFRSLVDPQPGAGLLHFHSLREHHSEIPRGTCWEPFGQHLA